jgi:hypothetical protein
VSPRSSGVITEPVPVVLDEKCVVLADVVGQLGFLMREVLPSPARPGPWLWPDPAQPGHTSHHYPHLLQLQAQDQATSSNGSTITAAPIPPGYMRAASAAMAAQQCRGGQQQKQVAPRSEEDRRCYDPAWVAEAMGAYYPYISFFVCNTTANSFTGL